MSKYTQLATDILDKVGGSANVNSLTHCVTRLRFKLHNENIAKTEELKAMKGIIGVVQAGGQYQVVIGNHVGDVFEEVMEVKGGSAVAVIEDAGTKEKRKPFDVILDALSGIFQPFLAIMAAGGMMRGLANLLNFLGWIDPGTFYMIDRIGDTVFAFLPVIIGLTAARKFKVNEFVGLFLGAALMNPQLGLNHLMAAADGVPLYTLFQGTMFEAPIYQTVIGLPWIARNFGGSVMPIIFIVLLAKPIQNVLKKYIPSVIANFFVPFFTILITMPLGFLLVGPIFTFATDLLMTGFQAIIGFNNAIYGLVVGFAWQLLVMFGLHWAVVPMSITQLAATGVDTIMAPIIVVSFGQMAALIALYFKMKKPADKAIALPAILSALVGITEPAIYGFTLPRKKVFIYTCIGGALGGLFAGMRGLTTFVAGGMGIFRIPNHITPDGSMEHVVTALIGIVIAMTVSFLLTWFFHKEPAEGVETVEKVKRGKTSIKSFSKNLVGTQAPVAEVAHSTSTCPADAATTADVELVA